jgi:hypothetical protein
MAHSAEKASRFFTFETEPIFGSILRRSGAELLVGSLRGYSALALSFI